MFGGFFKSKKKVEQAKAAERRDSFYEDDGDDGVADDDDNNMDDEEYGRRVTEEIAKRKSVNVTKHSTPVPHKSPSSAVPTKVPPKAPTPPPAAQTAPKATTPIAATVSKPTTAHAAPAAPAPKAVPAPAPVQATKPVTPVAAAPAKAAPAPVAAAPAKATAAPVAAAPISKPIVVAPVTAPTPVTPTAAASSNRPNSATSAPPVFVNPHAVSAARPNSATTAPVIPKVNIVASTRPYSAPVVPADKNAPPLDAKAIQQLVLMGFSYPASVMALQRCNNKSDQAAEFLLEHSEAEVNQMLAAQAGGKAISPKPVVPTPVAAPAPAKPVLQPVPVVAKVVEAPKPSAPPAHVPAAVAAKASPAPVATASSAPATPSTGTKMAPSSAVASTPPPAASVTPRTASPVPVLPVPSASSAPLARQASAKRAKPKEMEAVDTAMAAILAKREALKKQTPPATPLVTSCLSSPRGGTDASTTSSVFDKLSTYKTKGAAMHEQQEEEDRQRKEGQERRRKALAAPTSASSNNLLSSSTAGEVRTSIDNQTFEALFNKKTKSMVLNEKQDEEEKLAREAHERKWKKNTARDSLGSANLTSDSEAEVFDKLYTTKLKSHKISEQVEQEEKAHLEKVEAHTSGRTGASLAPTTPTPLLRKTQSAMLREQFTLEDKQKMDEERAAEERARKELAAAGSPGSRRNRRERGTSAERSLHASSGEDLAGSIDRSLQLARRSLASSSVDISDATAVDDFDTDDEGGDEQSKPSVPGSAVSRQASARGADFQKQSSFYTNGAVARGSSTKSFRTHVSAGVPGVVKRERLPQEVQETPEHMWVCKVVNAPRDGVSVNGRKAEIMVSVKGTYASKHQCKAIALANAPPRWAAKVKNALCGICDEAFNKYLKPENCTNCGQLVCADCSEEYWPVNMVPESFCDKKTVPRVCAACNILMEKAVAALKAGDLELVQLLHQTGNVNFHNQYSILPDAPYAVHCAAASGNLELMRWLAEELCCPSKDITTGEPLLNALGLSALAIAARKGDLPMMRYIVHVLEGSVTEIEDVSVLQRALHVALEAPGIPPMVTARKSMQKPSLASAASFRVVEKANSNGSLGDSSNINTDSLLLKAADLALRLRAPASARADAPPSLSSPSRSEAPSRLPSPPKAGIAAAAQSGPATPSTAAAQASPKPVSAAVPAPNTAVISVSSPKSVPSTPSASTPVVGAFSTAPSPAASPLPSPAPSPKVAPSAADAAALRRAASAARIAAKMVPPAPLQRKPSGSNLSSRPPLSRTPSLSVSPAPKKPAEAPATKTAAKSSPEKVPAVSVPAKVVGAASALVAEVPSVVEEVVVPPAAANTVSEALSMETPAAAADEPVPAPQPEPEKVLEVEPQELAEPAESDAESVDASLADLTVEDVVEQVKEVDALLSAVSVPIEEEAEADKLSTSAEANISAAETSSEQLPEGKVVENATAPMEAINEQGTEPSKEIELSSQAEAALETATLPRPEEGTTDVSDDVQGTVSAEAAAEPCAVPEVAVEAAADVNVVPTPELATESAKETNEEPTAELTIEVPPTIEPVTESAPLVASPEVDSAAEPLTPTEAASGASEPATPTSPTSPKVSPNGKNSRRKKKGGKSPGAADVATADTPEPSSAGFTDTKSSKRMNSMKMEPPAAENPTARMSALHRTSSGRSVSADGNSTGQPTNN